jgi:hypothetical protein
VEIPQEKTDQGDGLQTRCPYCGTTYLDEGGVLARLQEDFHAAPLLVVAGCGHCGRLFIPQQLPDRDPPPPGTSPAKPVQPAPQPRYLLYQCIGRGGMGETYRAVDRKTRTEVCVKKLFDPRFASALRQEWLALARLHHPGIVQLLDFVEEGPEVQLVMEYVSGQSLASLIQRSLLPEVLVTEFGVRLAEALVYAGEQQVIHCDLKPDNILVTRAGASSWPKILDFGLAIVEQRDDRGELTARGRRAGTVRYMAPEQFAGQQLTPACDIYALGLILDEMLRGQCAFSGDTWEVFANKQKAVEGIEPAAGCSAGLAVVHLLLLHTPPRGDALALGYMARRALAMRGLAPPDCVRSWAH